MGFPGGCDAVFRRNWRLEALLSCCRANNAKYEKSMETKMKRREN